MARVSIEDCLDHIENRFALVTVASHRTRQLMEGKTPLVKTKNKEAVTALREIAEGLVISNSERGAGNNSDAEHSAGI
jgi:DNA-directed RNA polymerase subunit omega